MPARSPKALPLWNPIRVVHQWNVKSTCKASVTLWRQQLHLQTRALQSSLAPFRKQLKDEAKRNRKEASRQAKLDGEAICSRLADWELTVGIEVHAQLNTNHKLFSRAATSPLNHPNAQVALFDLALPGTQPDFQHVTLLPALRAALALNCSIQKKSNFDRKHYFYHDQPAGYQITQYYSPFAKDGYINLDQHDGIAEEDGDSVKIGIKQIQMEQDTAKTIVQPPDAFLLDFNRAGHPLIEIISLPHIHHPQTAAAYVRKIQQVLQAVSSVTTGMELGGLRADVNVSVRSRKGLPGKHSYHGVNELGQRTEIKNLSSFKAVEDAIIAERDRQIEVLENGGQIEGETRGWTLGSTMTRKLRGKEGEVDYRYMPDPDLPSVTVGKRLVDHIRRSLPMLPDEQVRILTDEYGLTKKDAKTLVVLEGGSRLDYFQAVTSSLLNDSEVPDKKELGKIVSNWVIHELGGLISASGTAFDPLQVPSSTLVAVIGNLVKGKITGKTAKQLLSKAFNGDTRDVTNIILEERLQIQHLSEEEYRVMAETILDKNPLMANKVRAGQEGILQWFVGQMMREGKGRVDAQRAMIALKPILNLKR